MMLIAKGGLQLNGAHMHQNFRLKKDKNKKIVSVLYKVDFWPSSAKMPSSFRQAHGTANRLISKEKGMTFFFLMELHNVLHSVPESSF